jgi:hypothetical protein
MIDAYHRANPLDQETFEILWIDMAFPNEFYKHVKEIVFNPQEFLETELAMVLQRVMTTETSKWQALMELEKDKVNYPAGDYSSDYVKPSLERPAAVVVPGTLLTPVYADMPVVPIIPVTPVMPVVEEIISIPLEEEPVFTELPALVTMPEVPDTLEPVYSVEPVAATTPAKRQSKYDSADAPAKTEPISVPVTPEHVYAGDPAAVTVPPIPAIPLPALIQFPARGQKRFKLRVPRKRRALRKTKIIKKTRYLKRRKTKKLTKWKRVTGIKIIWGYRTWRAKKKLKPVLRPKKKQLKRKLGLKKPVKRVVKPYLKKMRQVQQPQRNLNAPPPLKKRQIQPRKRTA